MKIIIGEFRQESNSFNHLITDIGAFEENKIREGEDMVRDLTKVPCAVAGMVSCLKKNNATIVPSISMVAQSGGPVDQKVVKYFLDRLIAVIDETEPIDGILLSLHGATQSTEHDDVCGYILGEVRKKIGDDPVVSISCDLHANITESIKNDANVICGYQTYPHSDFFETGYRATEMVVRYLHGAPVKTAGVRVPMIVSANGYCTLDGPFSELIAYAKSLVTDKKILDISIFQMQPWLDVEDGGSSVIVIAEDEKVALGVAIDIATKLLGLRHQFTPKIKSIDEVIDMAEQNKTNLPIILVDSADSTNAGATGDSIAVIKRLIERNSKLKSTCAIVDVNAANMAHESGVGSHISLSIGGSKTLGSNDRIHIDAYVKSLHDGWFCQEGPAGRGLLNNVGRSAVLIVGQIDILVCTNMSGNGDPQLFRAFGIEPTFYRLVVVKANTSFRASYQDMSAGIYDANTPGAASSDLNTLDYKKIPKAFFPFSDAEDLRISEF